MKKSSLATVAVAAALATGTAACYGSFAATSKLYHWNGQVSHNGFVNSVVMWGLDIIPVYPLFMLGDLIIFNPIELFTGSNPLK